LEAQLEEPTWSWPPGSCHSSRTATKSIKVPIRQPPQQQQQSCHEPIIGESRGNQRKSGGKASPAKMFSMCTKVKSRSADADSSFMQHSQSQQMQQLQLQQPQAMGEWESGESGEKVKPKLRLKLKLKPKPKLRPERQSVCPHLAENP